MFKFFSQKGNTFVSNPFRYASLITALVFLILAFSPLIYGLLYGGIKSYLSLLFLIPTIIYGGNFGCRIEIDIVNKTMSRSYFGLMKSEFSYVGFQNFLLLKHMAMGMFHNGTDIIMVKQINGGKQEIKLFDRLHNKKNIQTITEEIRKIIGIQ